MQNDQVPSYTLDQLQKRMNWGLREIDYQLRAENIIIIRKGGELRFQFLIDMPGVSVIRYEPAKHIAKHISRKSA